MSCNRYLNINSDDIISVYIVYTSPTWNNYIGYQLDDGKIIKWDKNNTYVKSFLNKNLDKFSSYKKADTNHISKYIIKAKPFKYVAIKTVPLKEFGYIRMKSKKILLYGIIGERIFIDLSHNRVYH